MLSWGHSYVNDHFKSICVYDVYDVYMNVSNAYILITVIIMLSHVIKSLAKRIHSKTGKLYINHHKKGNSHDSTKGDI